MFIESSSPYFYSFMWSLSFLIGFCTLWGMYKLYDILGNSIERVMVIIIVSSVIADEILFIVSYFYGGKTVFSVIYPVDLWGAILDDYSFRVVGLGMIVVGLGMTGFIFTRWIYRAVCRKSNS
jgi:hypothetical protein